MFDIGWSEMTVVVVIALLVLGPKQLPEALKTITQLTRKARRYAQDFRSGIDNIVREAELEDAREALSSVRSANPSKALTDLIDPTGEVNAEMRDLQDTAKKSIAKDDAKSAIASSPEKDGPAKDEPEKDGPEKDGADQVGAKTVKTPESIAPSNSLRPPPGPDVFASAAPTSEPDPVPSVEPSSPPKGTG